MTTLTRSTPRLIQPLLLLGALVLTTSTSSQTLPDAGQLLRQQSPVPAVPQPKPPESSSDRPTNPVGNNEPGFFVKGFKIQGAVVIPEAELQELLQAALGRELGLNQLQDLAGRLIAHYAARGYLARVVIPPQDIKDGIVTLQVIEGRRGNVVIESTDPAMDVARIQRFIDARVDAGKPVQIHRLGEALAILNEQPGVSVRSALKPGSNEGEVDLVVRTEATAPRDYLFGINNQGTRATGEWQVSTGVTINNPTGRFDSLAILANGNDGIGFGRLDYHLALGDRGMRAGVHVSRLAYRVTQTDFDLAGLGAHGSADDHGLTLSYPFQNLPQSALRFEYRLEEKKLIDQTELGEIGNRRVISHTLDINGHIVGTPDSLFGAGTLSFSTAIVSGRSEQHNSAARDQDDSSRRSAGQFGKFTYQLGYVRPLNALWNMTVSLRGQFANKNLDSSERISLGGPGGVRAYPVAEATGDEGFVASVSLERSLQDKLTFKLLLDAGRVTVNRNTWDNWNLGDPSQPNRYDLLGAGAGIDWRMSKATQLSFIVATPLGNHPGSTAQGRNSDGTAVSTRGWFNLVSRF